ncbi:SIT4 phosphatase-associated protein [Trichostrongylus colubriformis]|uniref:SIT4 phosphatase-associated protein n=1 Tax=Trichostrongylus colubriformis TaxID=6319 RepID=A0AAN8G2S8_TRICO
MLQMFWEEEKKLGETKEETIDSYISANRLTDILELPYTLQELWGGNKKLIEYFCRDDVLTSLANFSLRPNIDESQPIKSQYKLPNACSEILTVRNNNEITNAFLECEDALKAVREFFDNKLPPNHLLCGFYMKIVQHLFHRSVDKALEILSSCDFISKCAANLRMGAVSELLQNIVWIPQVAEDFMKIKKWYVENELCRKLVEQLSPNQPLCVHENVMEVFSNLVRNTRDQMYALDIRSDVMNDELQSESLVRELLDKMLARNECGIASKSVSRNVCEILVTLLSSNHILFRPSHTLNKEFNAEMPWVGGNPSVSFDGVASEVAKEGAERLVCPDSERTVEKITSARVSEMIQLVIEDLESNYNHDDEVWSYLLRVVIELCDTNRYETHVTLVEQFGKCDMAKLFALVWSHPRCSIFHGLLQRIISFILYSSTQNESPAVSYLFKTLNLPEIIRSGIDPRCVFKKVDLFSLRTHHIHLALAVEQAMKSSPNARGVQKLVQECPFWSEIASKVDEWLSWNLPDPEVANVRPLNQHDTIDEALVEFERQIVAPQQHVLYEFKTQMVSVPMTDVFDTALGELQVSSETKGFAVHNLRVCKVDMNLEENDVDESDFEAMCAMKKSSLLDDWPTQDGDHSSQSKTFDDDWAGMRKLNGSTLDDWPGMSSSIKNEQTNEFQVQWDQAPAASTSGDLSPSPQDSSTPRKVMDDEEWADFSSLKNELPSTAESSSDWPGVGNGQSSDWPVSAETEAVDPVMAGFATVVINSSLDERVANESEC